MMDKRVFKLSEVIVIIVITALLSAVVTGFISYNTLIKTKKVTYVNLTNDKDLKEFLEVYAELVTDYYKDINKKELLDSAINGMTTYLDENYTTHLSKTDTSNLLKSLSGQYQGIGIEIKEDLVINDVFESSPAKKAGLEKGDKLIKVDNEVLEGKTASEAASLIKDSKKKSVVVTVLRDNKELEFTIELSSVNIPSVYGDVVTDTKIGYIYLNTFSNTTYTQFKDKLEDLEKKNITSLIIDVRGNGGGYLVSAKQIASLFIEQGKLIYSLEDKNTKVDYKDETKEKRSYPVVILIDENSASASEILTAALVDSYGAKTVGTTSYGKGKVQQTKELKDGSLVKFTSAKWLRPNGTCIDEVGITPDIKAELEVKDGKIIDSQYNKAVDYLKNNSK